MEFNWTYKIYYFDSCVLKKINNKVFKDVESVKKYLQTDYMKRFLKSKQIVICSRSSISGIWMIDEVINP